MHQSPHSLILLYLSKCLRVVRADHESPDPVSFGAEDLGVAGLAVDLPVGGIAIQHRVHRSTARVAIETFL